MHPVQPDQVLLQRFSQTRDERAFAELVRRYAELVYSTCLRVLKDRTRAEDVSQETFLRLMRRPDAVQKSLAGWLHTAATQLSIDSIRSESARRAREVSYATEPPQEASTWQEISPYVDESLADLPEMIRGLLVEHFMNGRSQTELAAEEGGGGLDDLPAHPAWAGGAAPTAAQQGSHRGGCAAGGGTGAGYR